MSASNDVNRPGYPPTANANAAAELDDILNAALDDLEDADDDAADDGGDLSHASTQGTKESSNSNGNNSEKQLRVDKAAHESTQLDAQNAMNKLIDDLQNPLYADTLQDSLQALSGTQEGTDTMEDYLGKQFKDSEIGQDGTDVDRTVSKLLNDLGKTSENMEGLESAQMENMGEDVMNQMMGEFEKLGEKEDYNEVIDGMMRQLLSKELMYDPMKQVCLKYPEWLAGAKAQLTEEDYDRYGKQYQYFQRIVAVYETEPDNFPRLMELMHDIQEFGQPPSEIIKELAPGLDFNEEGMPVMPNMVS
jgi:peroxin-19